MAKTPKDDSISDAAASLSAEVAARQSDIDLALTLHGAVEFYEASLQSVCGRLALAWASGVPADAAGRGCGLAIDILDGEIHQVLILEDKQVFRFPPFKENLSS